MFYKRKEKYRHSFGEPPEVCVETGAHNGQQIVVVYGLLLDISAQGVRIFTEQEIAKVDEKIKISFKIAHEKIQAKGKVVWKTEISGGWQYGIEWSTDPVREMLIAEEIKSTMEIR